MSEELEQVEVLEETEDTPKRIYVIKPWKTAFVSAVFGGVYALLYAIFPIFHRIPLADGGTFGSLYFAMAIPLLSSLWAGVGLIRRKRDAHTAWCLMSLFLAFFSLVFIVISAGVSDDF